MFLNVFETGNHDSHNSFRELLGQRRMTVQQPVIERAVQQVDGGLDVGAERDIAARERPLEDGPRQRPARFDEPFPVDGAKPWVAPGLGDQRADDPAVRPVAHPRDPRHQQFEQVTAQRAGVRRLAARVRPLLVERVEREHLLLRPPAVDRGLAHPGEFGDRVHADRGHPALEQEFRGGGEDRLPGGLAARPAP